MDDWRAINKTNNSCPQTSCTTYFWHCPHLITCARCRWTFNPQLPMRWTIISPLQWRWMNGWTRWHKSDEFLRNSRSISTARLLFVSGPWKWGLTLAWQDTAAWFHSWHWPPLFLFNDQRVEDCVCVCLCACLCVCPVAGVSDKEREVYRGD